MSLEANAKIQISCGRATASRCTALPGQPDALTLAHPFRNPDFIGFYAARTIAPERYFLLRAMQCFFNCHEEIGFDIASAQLVSAKTPEFRKGAAPAPPPLRAAPLYDRQKIVRRNR